MSTVFLLNADFAMTALNLISHVYLTSLLSGHPDSRCRIMALCYDDIMDIVFIFITVNFMNPFLVLVARY